MPQRVYNNRKIQQRYHMTKNDKTELEKQFAPLNEAVDKLRLLLADPHPGMFTWSAFVGQNLRAIRDEAVKLVGE